MLATSILSQKSLGDVNVNGRQVLDVTTEAYVLTTDIAWTNATNVGIEVLRSSDGTRHTNVGVFNGRVYVDRGPSESISAPFAPYTQSEAPIDPAVMCTSLWSLIATVSRSSSMRATPFCPTRSIPPPAIMAWPSTPITGARCSPTSPLEPSDP